MQPGNLVRTTRARIGVPLGTLALIVDFYPTTPSQTVEIWEVQFLNGRHRRFLEQDLEVIE
tara:strand:- start:465 stop:647 length:183 start_codon:yes stop_codon:yes gene_type:complete